MILPSFVCINALSTVVWISVSALQALFIKWVLTMFDLIDSKDQLRAIYGFIFNFVIDENLVRDLTIVNLTEHICHLNSIAELFF